MFSNLFNRADSDRIAESLREFQLEKVEAQKMQAQQQQMQQQQQGQQMAQMQQQEAAQGQMMMENENQNLQLDRDAEMDRTALKEVAKNTREDAKINAEASAQQNIAQPPPPNV